MARVSGIKRITVSIEIDFAPNRMADENIANAYELALPLVARTVNQKQRQQKCKKNVNESTAQLRLGAINE